MSSQAEKKKMTQDRSLILYHRTTARNARAILEGGFQDSTGYFLNTPLWTGVWLSAQPLNKSDVPEADTLLMVKLDISERELARWEWTAEGRSFREWLIPAKVINQRMSVEVVDLLDSSTVAA